MEIFRQSLLLNIKQYKEFLKNSRQSCPVHGKKYYNYPKFTWPPFTLG